VATVFAFYNRNSHPLGVADAVAGRSARAT